MRVLIIGPGKIGCGYLAPLFADAGWEVTLAARTEEARDRIRAASGFRVRVTGDSTRRISGMAAVAVGTPEFHRAVRAADLLTTSVGVGKVAALGPALARAFAARGRPVDVWVVENQDCGPALEGAIRSSALQAHLALPSVGIAGAIATVAVSRGDWRDEGVPVFVGDSQRELLVDARRVGCPPPTLPGVQATTHYRARLHEKLFVFNTGHALCAFLGRLRGHRTVDQAVGDGLLRPLIAGCLLESRSAIVRTHPELGSEVHAPVADALARYRDEELADPIVRVARDPIRKLAPHDRLLGPARLIRQTLGYVPPHFALGIAAALLYRNDNDAQACRLAEMLVRKGVLATLRTVCGLGAQDELTQAVAARYRGFILTAGGAIFPPLYDRAYARVRG